MRLPTTRRLQVPLSNHKKAEDPNPRGKVVTGHKSAKVQSKPPYATIPTLRPAQTQKRTAPTERARKTGKENAMACYVSIKTSQNMKDRKFIKSEKKC